jgi:hypothetical protein
MTERTHPQTQPDSTPAPEVPAQSQARPNERRRHGPGSPRPSKPESRWARYVGIAFRDLVIVVVLTAAVIFSVRRVNPVFANQPRVAEALVKRVPGVAKAALAPTPRDSSELEQLVASPEFEAHRKKFAADLVATGRVVPARADSIAFYAVRESYVRGIPPAVVFGVMLTENSRFVSGAMSDVGAVGLMQIYPKVWLKALQAKFGKDLATDSTNVKYGVYILSTYVKSTGGAVTQRDLAKGLLRYNGCVTGSHTPHCHNYPTKVQSYVERQAESLCGDKTLYDCIAKPFVNGLFGKRETTQ